MSIHSIDAQIMIARTADYMRDASALQKRPEVAQDYLAVREKINDARDQTRVGKTPESEAAMLNPDGGDGGAGGYEGSPGYDKRGKKDDDDANMLVPPGSSHIDIKV